MLDFQTTFARLLAKTLGKINVTFFGDFLCDIEHTRGLLDTWLIAVGGLLFNYDPNTKPKKPNNKQNLYIQGLRAYLTPFN